MGKTVGEMLQQMSAYELAEWRAFWKLREEEREQKQLEQKAAQGVERNKAR